MLSSKDLIELKNKGFVIKKNILPENIIIKIKNIILRSKEGKGGKNTYYPSNLKKIIIKISKFEFKRALAGVFFLKLKKNLKLDVGASQFFDNKAELIMIDGYWNRITKQEILPWHSDQAYRGAEYVEKIASPENFSLKFFFYLTEVGPNNGCTSYIPFSQKITYAVRSCLYEKKIDYQPFWSVQDLVKIIEKKQNYHLIKQKLEEKSLLENFLISAKKCIYDKSFTGYDFIAKPGDVLIFNEGGVHRGSNPSLNDRVVLRYLYSKKNNQF